MEDDISPKRFTPGRAIRLHCIDCTGGFADVHDCGGDKLWSPDKSVYQCVFYPYRFGEGRPSVKLIRQFCVYCMGGSEKPVRECASKTCQFMGYRMGKNPKMAGHVNVGSFKAADTPRQPSNFDQESTADQF